MERLILNLVAFLHYIVFKQISEINQNIRTSVDIMEVILKLEFSITQNIYYDTISEWHNWQYVLLL